MNNRGVRPIRVVGNVAFVPLTKGYEAIIDAADVPLVEGWNWHVKFKDEPKTLYAARTNVVDGKVTPIRMHRVIVGCDAGMQVDHVNGNGLDNRRANLRTATPSENGRNRRVRADSASGIRGVRVHPQTGNWIAYITCNGRRKHLGSFPDAESAAEAYARASAQIHGKFGRVS